MDENDSAAKKIQFEMCSFNRAKKLKGKFRGKISI